MPPVPAQLSVGTLRRYQFAAPANSETVFYKETLAQAMRTVSSDPSWRRSSLDGEAGQAFDKGRAREGLVPAVQLCILGAGRQTKPATPLVEAEGNLACSTDTSFRSCSTLPRGSVPGSASVDKSEAQQVSKAQRDSCRVVRGGGLCGQAPSPV